MDSRDHGPRPPSVSSSNVSPSEAAPLTGSCSCMPQSFPKFEHPSHELLKENGFTQQVYQKYRRRCLSESTSIGKCMRNLDNLLGKMQKRITGQLYGLEKFWAYLKYSQSKTQSVDPKLQEYLCSFKKLEDFRVDPPTSEEFGRKRHPSTSGEESSHHTLPSHCSTPPSAAEPASARELQSQQGCAGERHRSPVTIHSDSTALTSRGEVPGKRC
nr:uncharacterized protein LOC499603 isoform X2 [Rattus norvegicus]